MPFTTEQAVTRWPWLYHLTAAGNVPAIRKSAALVPAATLFEASDSLDRLRMHRPTSVTLPVTSRQVEIRDQRPLRPGNIRFEAGFDIGDLVELLNHHVFFWPGTADDLSRSGRNHFERYRAEAPAMLRVRFDALLAHASDVEPRFCRYNSGAPRCSRGRRSPRGPGLFIPGSRCTTPVGKIVEVVFRGPVPLALSTEIRSSADAQWDRLFASRGR